MKRFQILGVTPFEQPDVSLVLALEKSGVHAVLHVGRDRNKAAAALKELSESTNRKFGVCLATPLWEGCMLPDAVDLLLLPFGMELPLSLREGVRLLYQVCSIEEARRLKAAGMGALIIKGNEGAGQVGDESSFILFQQIRREMAEIEIWVQGGVGIHSAAAFAALGAAGIILDSQLVLFDECKAPAEVKKLCRTLSGHETRVIDHYRVLVRPNSPALSVDAGRTELEAWIGGWEVDKGYLPLGQDIALAADLVQRFRKLNRLITGIGEAVFGQLRQAKAGAAFGPGNALAAELHIQYPIAQGPMTRVSDVAAFARAVAVAGGLPFVALSLLKGEQARQLIRETREQMVDGGAWGVGILGFVPPELREEQIRYIMEEKPPVVLIAGGRPAQARPLEKAGIRTFLHVPSVTLLDLFLKEGARRFVFEGRECGGHVGPLFSLVLWEKQIVRLLQEEHAEEFDLFFAGGIHDALSAAFVAVMAAPLVARGARVGVLMGTAYLYTEEAVTTGAIVRSFQEQAIVQSGTLLLETAPGHETRCLDSAFAGQFSREKERLRGMGLDKQEIWSQLENMNVGRLRIAAKGVERQGENLVGIGEDEQLTSGMYMIGQVVALKDRVLTMRELHGDVGEGSAGLIREAEMPETVSTGGMGPGAGDKALNVAVIGMACIYPGARNIDEYWRNIILGKDCVTEVPDERWNKEIYYDPQSTNGEKSPSKWGGFIPKIDFDPMDFGIPPQSLAAIEPSQLLSLLVARQALENAGYAGPEANKENVSVIIGAEGGNDLSNNYGFRCLFRQVFGEMPAEVDQALPRLTEDSFPGVLANVIAGRITNRLDLGGRNYTVDAACASSLAAIDLACQELILVKSDMVIAGAVDLHNGINDYLLFSSTHALSRKGRCLTFDAGADGIALGEGVAMLVLKRQEDAQRDGDTVYAVIKGVGGSSDGKSLGLTAPRKAGQESALSRAYQQAGLSPARVGLIEAHGTGTVVGDRTELSALTDLMTLSGALPGQVHLGSVKTQIGHTKCAAGMAGMIKAILSVYHGIKPPTLHLRQPNSYYRPGTSPFAFRAEAALWSDASRVAGVSAFGFGGTNFHAVLENSGQPAVPGPVLNAWPAELFVFRGDDYEEAMQLVRVVREILMHNDSIEARDLAYSLVVRSGSPVQLSIVAGDTEDLLLKMDLALEGAAADGLYPLKPVAGKTALLFPGQGSQHINMARELFVLFPAMRALLVGYPEYERVLFPDAAFDEPTLKEQKEKIRDTRVAQPLLGMVDHAIAGLLREWGIVADMVAGHSYGELPALCYAGVIREEDLVDLSEKRAGAILAAVGADRGAMVAVNLAPGGLTGGLAAAGLAAAGSMETGLPGDLAPAGSGVYVVNHNSPRQWVLAGGTRAIAELIERLKEKKISFRQLEVACAFHSPLLAGARDLFLAALQGVELNEAAVPVWSNTTASEYPSAVGAIRERLADHLVQPVKFSEEIEKMYEQGARVFVEVGPGRTLSGLTRDILGRDELVLHTGEKAGLFQLLCVAGAYMASGRAVRLEKLFDGRAVKRLDLGEPDRLSKSATVWIINGQMAVPVTGVLPGHGAMPVVKPLNLLNRAEGAAVRTASVGSAAGGATASVVGGAAAPAVGAERVVEEFLKSMQLMIQAQRDVLLGYLGQAQAVRMPVSGMVGVALDGGHAGVAREGLIRAGVAHEGEARAGSANPVLAQSEPARASMRLGKGEIKEILLKIVSDKTGYPPDMLDLNLDMEADLSIDSIKRMEIIAALKTGLGDWPMGTGRPGDDNNEDLTEQMASIKTLQGLIDWIVRSVAESAGAAASAQGSVAPLEGGVAPLEGSAGPVEEAKKIIEEGFVHRDGEDKLLRLRFEWTSSGISRSEPDALRGSHFAITDDGGGGAIAIRQWLEKHGAGATVISEADPLEAYDGLILLDLFASPRRCNLLESFSLVKKLDMARVRWIYVVSDFNGHLREKANPASLRYFQGYGGFLKSLDKEFGHIRCRSINLDMEMSPEKMAGLVVDELLHADNQPEVSYEEQLRKTMRLVPSELTIGHQSDIQLDAQSVVLVLGGAQGITAELMMRFSREYPCRYILVGRSPDPRQGDAMLTMGEAGPGAARDASGAAMLVTEGGTRTGVLLKTREAIREFLIGQGHHRNPAEIEKRVDELYKAHQILHTITSLENNGARVDYHSLDCREEDKLDRLLVQIYKTHGRIDGVVHGAGLLEDKLFRHKTPESFERVYSTKVNPLRALAERLKADTQFVVLFSSVASVYGNRGQTDYAAANSVMDRYARELKKKISGKVISINWGPWKGAGMVSPALEREYERRDISLIPLPQGMESFLNELKYGNESQVLIMAGKPI